MNDDKALAPLHVFRFHVDFEEEQLGHSSGSARPVPLCSGAFSECTGLEATMEPKVIKEGGLNYGANQRAGPVTFATVILKRGMTRTRDLWKWFELVSGGAYAYRLAAIINMYDAPPIILDKEGNPVRNVDERVLVLRWRLTRAVPIKFKAADLNARGTEVGVEELHLAHEGLRYLPPPPR